MPVHNTQEVGRLSDGFNNTFNDDMMVSQYYKNKLKDIRIMQEKKNTINKRITSIHNFLPCCYPSYSNETFFL